MKLVSDRLKPMLLTLLMSMMPGICCGYAPDVQPDNTFQGKGKELAPRAMQVIALPRIPDIGAYMPVLKFTALRPGATDFIPALSVMVNDNPLPARTWKQLPTVINRERTQSGKAVCDRGKLAVGGEKQNCEYYLNLERLLKTKDANYIILRNESDAPLQLGDWKLFYLPAVKTAGSDRAWCDKDAFTLHQTRSLRVDWHGEPLIVKDSMVGIADLAKVPEAPIIRRDKYGKVTANNLIHRNDETVNFRREAALLPDGALELSLRAAYGKDIFNTFYMYTFAIPAKLLDGANYEFRSGLSGYNPIRGKFDFQGGKYNGRIFFNPKNPKQLYSHLRYLYLEKDGKKLIFDFNAYGILPNSMQPFCNDPAGTMSFISKNGDLVEFVCIRRHAADRYAAKLRISSGDYDYYDRHGNTVASYWTGPFHDNQGWRISFAKKADTARRNAAMPDIPFWKRTYVMPLQSVELNPAIPQLTAGWQQAPADAKFFSYPAERWPIAAGLMASGPSELVIPVTPGLWSVQLTMGNAKASSGAFNVDCNGENAVHACRIPAGEYRQLFATVYVRPGSRDGITLKFDGENYALNQLIVRNIATSDEDFSLGRDFWVEPGLADFGRVRDPLKANDFKPQQKALTGVELTPSTPVAAPKLSFKPLPAAPPLPPVEDDWLWDINMTELSYGAANGESGFQFRDEAAVRRRCETLKKNGVNMVVEQGLFWNNCFTPQSRQELIEQQKWVNKIVHEYGIKVIRHVDGPSFGPQGDGLRTIGMFPGAFNQNIDSMQGGLTIGCISNPALRKYVIERIGKYVKETDADGVMVDECVIASREHCGCIHCRKKFTADTNCVLPMPGETSVVYDDENPLAARWTQWKKYQNAEFNRELREYLQQLRPGTIVTTYSTNFQLFDGGVRVGYRTDCFAPFVDALGTEGSPVNIFANYRTYNVLCKLVCGMVTAYRHPAWTLVYDYGLGNGNMMGYMGQAIAAVNLQGVWLPSYMSNAFSKWQGKMPAKYSRPWNDVAILARFDERCFDEDGKALPFNDAAGISQMLTDTHIPHRFIMPHELFDGQTMRQFKLLIIGNARIMSDKELAAIRGFVSDGGKLLISGSFADTDEFYRPADGQRFVDVTGVELKNNRQALPVKKLRFKGESLAAIPTCVQMKNISAAVLGVSEAQAPLITIKDYQKGRVAVSSMPLGLHNYEKLCHVGRKWEYQPLPVAPVLLAKLLQELNYTHSLLTVAGVGSQVLVEPYRDWRAPRCFIQLLNFSGTRDNKVGVVPGSKLPPDAFASPTEDVKLTLHGKVLQAQATSPDYPETVTLAVRELDGGRSEITLPKDKLRIYTLITAEMEQQ